MRTEHVSTIPNPLVPRWIRLTDYGQKQIQQAVSDQRIISDQSWEWFCGVAWDYRESFARGSRLQTVRTIVTRFFLWCAEKTAGSKE